MKRNQERKFHNYKILNNIRSERERVSESEEEK